MIFKFLYPSVEPVRDFDKGRLVRAGLAWDEESPGIYWTSFLLIGSSVFFIVMLFFLNAPIPVRAAQGAGVSILCLVAGLFLFPFRFKKRALIFTADGELLTPHGIPGYPFLRKIRGHHANIDSIAMIPSDRNAGTNNRLYVVKLFSYDGDIVQVTADKYHHDYAYRIRMQLTNALNSFR